MSNISITEHAKVRWIERTEKRNIKREILKEIKNNKLRKLINNFKTGKFPTKNLRKLVIKNKKIITVL